MITVIIIIIITSSSIISGGVRFSRETLCCHRKCIPGATNANKLSRFWTISSQLLGMENLATNTKTILQLFE